MNKKRGDTILAVIFLIGIVSLGSGIFDKGLDSAERIVAILIGFFLCVFSLFSTVRQFLFALFFLGLFLASIPLVFTESESLGLNIFQCLLYLGLTIHFSRKVFIQRPRGIIRSVSLSMIDQMSGLEFEHFTAELLQKLGYSDVRVTPASGDHGIDVLANSDNLSFAFQCKLYHSPIGNSAVQEAYAGKAYYDCDIAVVVTNSTFTKGARELSEATGVLLWDRQTLYKMIRNAGMTQTSFDDIPEPTQYEENPTPIAADLTPASFEPKWKPIPSFKSTQKTHIPSVDPAFIAESQWHAARKDRSSDSEE